MLNDEQKQYLLRIARATVEAAVTGGERSDLHTEDPALLEKRGAFVTLKHGGDLRGCLGYVEGIEPLIEAVAENAEAAALRDPRFAPVRASELPGILIEVSALTPLQLVEDPEAVEVGAHGLMVCLGPNRGLLLPQVAEEWGWDREQFLQQTCRKAGLAPDEWNSPRAELYSFEAEVFGEEDYPELLPGPSAVGADLHVPPIAPRRGATCRTRRWLPRWAVAGVGLHTCRAIPVRHQPSGASDAGQLSASEHSCSSHWVNRPLTKLWASRSEIGLLGA